MDAYSAPTDRTTGNAVDGDTDLNVGALPIAEFLLDSRAVMAAVETVIDGKREAVAIALPALLTEGHLLVQDLPGHGRTLPARAPSYHVSSIPRIIN